MVTSPSGRWKHVVSKRYGRIPAAGFPVLIAEPGGAVEHHPFRDAAVECRSTGRTTRLRPPDRQMEISPEAARASSHRLQYLGGRRRYRRLLQDMGRRRGIGHD